MNITKNKIWLLFVYGCGLFIAYYAYKLLRLEVATLTQSPREPSSGKLRSSLFLQNVPEPA